MRAYKIFLPLIVVAILGLFFYRTPVKAAGTNLHLAILPLQCTLEVVDDGLKVQIRMTPQSCERGQLFDL